MWRIWIYWDLESALRQPLQGEIQCDADNPNLPSHFRLDVDADKQLSPSTINQLKSGLFRKFQMKKNLVSKNNYFKSKCFNTVHIIHIYMWVSVCVIKHRGLLIQRARSVYRFAEQNILLEQNSFTIILRACLFHLFSILKKIYSNITSKCFPSAWPMVHFCIFIAFGVAHFGQFK